MASTQVTAVSCLHYPRCSATADSYVLCSCQLATFLLRTIDAHKDRRHAAASQQHRQESVISTDQEAVSPFISSITSKLMRINHHRLEDIDLTPHSAPRSLSTAPCWTHMRAGRSACAPKSRCSRQPTGWAGPQTRPGSRPPGGRWRRRLPTGRRSLLPLPTGAGWSGAGSRGQRGGRRQPETPCGGTERVFKGFWFRCGEFYVLKPVCDPSEPSLVRRREPATG